MSCHEKPHNLLWWSYSPSVYVCMYVCMCVCARAHACARSCSAMSDSMTPWTVALQASLRGSPDPGIKPVSLASTALAGIFFTTSTPAAAAAKSLQSCPTLCDPIDSSPPGSSVPGILQARILELVAIAFSNAWKWKVKVKLLSHVRLFATPWDCSLPGSSTHGIFQARVLEWGAIAFSAREALFS